MQVIIELHRSQQADDPFAFRSGRQEYARRTAGGGLATASFDWDEALLLDLEAIRRPGCDPVIGHRIGQRLQRFMAGLDETHDIAAIAAAAQRHERVTLSLRFSAAELFALPWEFLTVKGSGQHLGELPGLTLRYEWPETESAAESPLPRAEGGRILFAWSAAGGSVPAAAHQRALAAAAAPAPQSFEPSRDVLPHASLAGLEAALEAAAAAEPIAILHILAHGSALGSTIGLVLDGSSESAQAEVVDAGRLRQLLLPHVGRVRLVVLCACDSGNSGALGNQLGSVAQALHRAGIAAVVASRFPLSAVGSELLASTLYEGLLKKKESLEGAVITARQRLLLHKGYDWAAVQLYSRSSDGDDTRPIVFRPYRGLLAFGPEHAQFFFGHKREADELIADLRRLEQHGQPRLLVVAGASGTGKSSLVLAAAVPALCEAGQRTALIIRPGEVGAQLLETALAGRTASAPPLLLVVDQFEEVFTRLPASFRQQFTQGLWSLASQLGAAVSVILTLRVDFLGRCGELTLDGSGTRLDQVAYDEQHRVFIAQLGSQGLREAIEQPAAQVGLQLEAGLCERILADVADQPGTLPLLEYSLDLLWQRRKGRLLTQEAYTALGGVTGALEGEAEKLLMHLSEQHRQIARRMLVALVEVRGMSDGAARRRALVSELRPTTEPGASAFDEVLDRLVSARLLVRDETHEAATVEVAHEALIRQWKQLRDWVQADREKLIALSKLRAWSAEWQQFRGALLRDDQLGYAREVQRNHHDDLDESVQKLIAASEQAAEQQARELRWRRWTLAGAALMVALVLALAGFVAQRDARRVQAASRLAMAQAMQLQRQMRAAEQRLQEARRSFILASAWGLSEQEPQAAALLLLEMALDSSADARAALAIARTVLRHAQPQRPEPADWQEAMGRLRLIVQGVCLTPKQRQQYLAEPPALAAASHSRCVEETRTDFIPEAPGAAPRP